MKTDTAPRRPAIGWTDHAGGFHDESHWKFFRPALEYHQPLLTQNTDTIIQDFYERFVDDHPPEVRAFIEEELLTESGFRENMALEQARRRLTQRGGPATALDDLVRRLLQVEQRHDVQRIELTHDVLTEVIRKSRDLRREKEAIQLAGQREAEVRAKLRRSRANLALASALSLIFLTIAGYAWYERVQAAEQRDLAKQQEALAALEAKRADGSAKSAGQQRDTFLKDVIGCVASHQSSFSSCLIAARELWLLLRCA